MKEIRTIIDAYDTIDHIEIACALAIVIRVEGSSYRRTGARMLVMDNGQWVGGISGGCLEGDALKRAKLAIYNQKPSNIIYDTSETDSNNIGIGLGCNGVIEVQFVPIKTQQANNPIELLRQIVNGPRNLQVLVTITKGNLEHLSAGHSIIYLKNNPLFANISLNQLLNEIVENQIVKGHSSPIIIEHNGEPTSIFIEIIPPETHLYIFGHQYDVLPLVTLANNLGWRIFLVANSLKINAVLKKLAQEIIEPNDMITKEIDSFSAAVYMAHDLKTDTFNVAHNIEKNWGYQGLLGPKVRSEKIFESVHDLTFNFEKIFAPTGLDVGATSPEEIALSILAEIKAVFENKKGLSLKHKTEPIHTRQ